MFEKFSFSAAERFMRYVQIDTQSDPHSDSFPSTEKQKNLSKLLEAELLQLGLADAHMDAFGYVYATLPSNSNIPAPVICFCAHVDTAPDCSGTHVKPILHEKYDGSDIVLPDDHSQVITTKTYPYLKEHIGHDIITASGLTLLGADDKSGVAVIMDMINYFVQHPLLKHGDIKILFTPDEEVGKGTANVDLKKLGARFAYTLDGGEAGTLEDETFSADGAVITIDGVIAHPGYAKNSLVNAIKIAGEIAAALPPDLSPEHTCGRQGFIHPVHISGTAEKAAIEFIIRDFVTANLLKHEALLKQLMENIAAKYPKAKLHMKVHEQYRNMKEVLDTVPQVIANAKEAYKRAGITIISEPIRGGTDGSRLSFMGLPCPNLFTGMQAIHSRHEWVGVKDMNRAVQMLVHLVLVWHDTAN